MSRLFNVVKGNRPKRNLFDLSHEKKLSCNMGDLVPIFMQDVVPGDKFSVNTETLIRLSPMLAPVMHRMNVFIHYFWVPYRLVYGEWEKFITGGESGNDVPAFPTIQIQELTRTAFVKGSLADYLGIPVTDGMPVFTGSGTNISALPFRAYQMIWNEYYRDQNLQAKQPVTNNSTVDWGTEGSKLVEMKKRAWEKDYFTSALPWAQRGGDVLIPTDVAYKDYANVYQQGPGQTPIADGSASFAGGAMLSSGGGTAKIENIEGMEATINDLRRAIRLQEWLERNARSGSRYVEQILAHFGVVLPDYRAQRPIFLGGGKSPIVISEVLANFDSVDTPGGTMYGHGIGVGNTNRFKHFFPEHGIILGIMSILPRTAYQQGLHKSWQKFDKFDYYFPEFAHLGEQEIKQSELYATYDAVADATLFGYQSRYAEYKFNLSSVHGDFRDDYEFWHMGRKFTSAPTLSPEFITSDPTHRIFAVNDPAVQKCIVQLYNNVKALRPMPVFGTPYL